ncbi:Copper-exporting P-type ATPase A [termite gut metagenome]|jgi:copper chaperone CopZ|uniref:Copper-exporting P-type ATPase A n=1 Tax=termite gut metagenome TaxID=433724 RepID=A0A5J4S756_9ZZZZ|nr:heavy-metal-associated domain-containing protein [Mediterranea sp.]
MKKNRFITFALTVFLFFSSIFNAIAQDNKDTKKKKTESITFTVNMHCSNCQSRLEKNIPWEKGVKDFRVDLENKTVTVLYDPQKTTADKLKKAIEKLDFTCEKKEPDSI